jgi:hypothetical protein
MGCGKRIVRAFGVLLMLLASAVGCRNSSGTLGKAKLSVLNVVSLEGEGISWDNRVPGPATQPSR